MRKSAEGCVWWRSLRSVPASTMLWRVVLTYCMNIKVLGLGMLSFALLPWPALACQIIPWENHEILADPQDSSPPGRVVQVEGEVENICMDIWSARLSVTPPLDYQTPALELGYSIQHVGGTLPEGLQLPGEPVRPYRGRILLHWLDSPTDPSPVDFSVSVAAVDTAGNQGAASDPIRFRYPLTAVDPPSEGSETEDEEGPGCSIAYGSRPGHAPLVLSLLGLLAVARRRSVRVGQS